MTENRKQRKFVFSRQLERLFDTLLGSEFQWAEGMEVSPSSVDVYIAEVYDIVDGLQHSISIDENRKMTKGDVDAPAYTEEYLRNAWPDKDVLDFLRKTSKECMTSDVYDIFIRTEGDASLANIADDEISHDCVEVYNKYMPLVKKELAKKQYRLEQIQHYYQYESQVYSLAASIVEMASDYNTIMSMMKKDVDEALQQIQGNGETRSEETLQESYAWWVADKTAAKGYPNPCLQDIVMCSLDDRVADAFNKVLDGGKVDGKTFSAPLQKMAEAYEINVKQWEELQKHLPEYQHE
jgi:hypothetical protein